METWNMHKAELHARINLRGRRETDNFFNVVGISKTDWNKKRRIDWEKYSLRQFKTLSKWVVKNQN